MRKISHIKVTPAVKKNKKNTTYRCTLTLSIEGFSLVQPGSRV